MKDFFKIFTTLLCGLILIGALTAIVPTLISGGTEMFIVGVFILLVLLTGLITCSKKYF